MPRKQANKNLPHKNNDFTLFSAIKSIENTTKNAIQIPLVMANYDQKGYLYRIVTDALVDSFGRKEYGKYEDNTNEQYQIVKSDYEAFRDKYSVKRQ